MNTRFDALRSRGALSPLDFHFARTLCRLVEEKRFEVLLGAALVSRYTSAGHVCVSLRELTPIPELEFPEIESWLEALRTSPLVGEGQAPLVLDDAGRLYLDRYWGYENRVARRLTALAAATTRTPLDAVTQSLLDRLFPLDPARPQEPGRSAAEATLKGRLTVITGGPGTGKTSTVVKLLALLVEARALLNQPPLVAKLLAPTGKAAARLSESIRARKAELPCSAEIKAAIPEQSATIHRGLGWLRNTPTRFVHDQTNPLSADLVVVDEASMVDLALLAKLVDALPDTAQLILLGDEDQLASVEVGAILGDICNRRAREIPTQAPIARTIFRLEKSHRFGVDSGIGGLASSIQAGDAPRSLEVLADPGRPDVNIVVPVGRRALPRELVETAVARYKRYLEAPSPALRAQAFGAYRVLCAHATGPGGVSAANLEIESALAQSGAITIDGRWYHGRPIMVRENDYQLELYNGDVGFIVRSPEGELRAEFTTSDGVVRQLSPARLPIHDTVYAMTIHKSQGSEMDEVGILLPDEASPILSRELLYTAVTRARRRVTVYARPEVVTQAVERRVQRASGLTDRLWGAKPRSP